MTGPEEMDELRARLRRAEQDAAAARILAGGADRDVGEIRAELREFRAQNTRLHNATREDLTALREHVDRGFAQADQNFLALRGAMDGMAALLQVMVDRSGDGEGDEHPPR